MTVPSRLWGIGVAVIVVFALWLVVTGHPVG